MGLEPASSTESMLTPQQRLSVAVVGLSLLCFGSCGPLRQELGFAPIFDGETFTGWRADPQSQSAAWSVQDGAIQGMGLEDRLTYLVYSGDEELRDFELKFSYRMRTEGNTGVELRGRVDKTGTRPFEGYHADLGHVGIGPHILGAWDFHFAARWEFPCPRGTRLVIDNHGAGHPERIEKHVAVDDIKRRDWNRCHILAKGNRFRFFINGMLSSEFVDGIEEGSLDSGFIALQLHDKGTVVQFKDILLKRQ